MLNPYYTVEQKHLSSPTQNISYWTNGTLWLGNTAKTIWSTKIKQQIIMWESNQSYCKRGITYEFDLLFNHALAALKMES